MQMEATGFSEALIPIYQISQDRIAKNNNIPVLAYIAF
jgi:hypothetical protein